MWQVAGGHGQIDTESAIDDMLQYQKLGFTTWDMADIYGPAESLIGKFKEKLDSEESIPSTNKICPKSWTNESNSIVTHYIEQSLKKLKTDCIDLLTISLVGL